MIYLLVFLFFASAHGSDSKRYKSVVHVLAENDTSGAYDVSDVRCFHYSWLGNYNNVTFIPYINKTCAEKYAGEKPMPLCVNPMLATDNNEEPNSTWLVDHMYDSVTCRLSSGYTCAKFTYRFNGKVQNITRYCTKVEVGGTALENSCITSDEGAYQKEICACNKMLGKMPCNGSEGLKSALLTQLIPLLLFLFVIRQ